LLPEPPEPDTEFLDEVGGNQSQQDVCDNRLLYALKRSAVALLVTQDRGLHAKAMRVGLHQQCYYVTQAISFLERLSRKHRHVPPTVRLRPLHAISLDDPLFESIRQDYDGFDGWFRGSAASGRECWVVAGDSGKLAALCIFKPEFNPFPEMPGSWLKLCTFKVAAEMSGRKLGELLLKTAFMHCLQTEIPAVYLTVFQKQRALIAMLAEFGFQKLPPTKGDEWVLGKYFSPIPGEPVPPDNLGFNKLYFPNFLDDENVEKYIVPVRPGWHEMLFPEWPAEFSQVNMFPSGAPVSNAMRKAYLCNSPLTKLRPGDLLYFYRSQDRKAVTTVAVVEQTMRSGSADAIAAFVGKRTVYKLEEIRDMCANGETLAIVFRQCRHVPQPVRFQRLKSLGILRNHVETITRISHQESQSLRKEAGL
jgi:hypothetical protein